jgi:hypothetical protein
MSLIQQSKNHSKTAMAEIRFPVKERMERLVKQFGT